MTDIFDEVEGEYRAEQVRAVAARYAWLAGAIVLAVLIGAGGWQLWRSRQAQANAQAAAAYLEVSKAADGLGSATTGGAAVAQRFADLAVKAPPGYATLARFRQAGLLADAGQLSAAQTVWDHIASDPNADPLLRQLASLLWVERGLDSSDPAALRTRLVSLTTPDDPYRPLAREAEALLDLRLGQTGPARVVLMSLTQDASTPDGVRGRAGALLARLGS